MKLQATASIESLRQALSLRLGQERFSLWFAGRTDLQLDGDTLRIGVPNLHFQQWLEGRFGPQVLEVVQSQLGHSGKFRFHIDPTLFQELRQEQKKAEGLTQPAKPAQTSQPPARKKVRRLDQFVATETTRPAFFAAQRFGSGELDGDRLLFLHGGNGQGKSHLLEGIAQLRRSETPQSKILLQTAEEFVNDFLEALRTQKQSGFRKRMRGLDLWLVDDLEGLVGKQKSQEEFLATLDALGRTGATVVLAMQSPPSQCKGLIPELSARVAGGLVCQLSPLDQGARRTLLAHLLAKAPKLHLEDSLLELISRKVRGSGRECEGLVQTLKHHCLASGKPPTESMVRGILGPWIRSDRKTPTINEVMEAFTQVVSLTPEQIKRKSRSPLFSHARLMAMYLARVLTGATCKEVGKWFQRQHSTVVSAEKKIRSWQSDKSRITVGLRSWRVDEMEWKVKGILGLDQD